MVLLQSDWLCREALFKGFDNRFLELGRAECQATKMIQAYPYWLVDIGLELVHERFFRVFL